MMQIKLPPCYDISHYKDVVNFHNISPFPILIIAKATEGTAYVDDKFAGFMTGMKDAGIRRGAYHFHRKALDPTAQAIHFSSTCKLSGITDDDILVLDVEEGGETATQLKTWLETVIELHPNNKVMIYSRKNILDPIPTFFRKRLNHRQIRNLDKRLFGRSVHPLDKIKMNVTEQAFFQNIPVWTAGYPYSPDLYDAPPATYIPDQTRWGEVLLWQYSDNASVSGISGSVDVNWVAPRLIEWLEGTPVGDTVSTFKSATITKGHRESPRSFNFVVVRFPRKGTKISMPGKGFLATAKYYYDNYGKADIIINGGEAYYPPYDPVKDVTIKGYGVSEGVVFDDKTEQVCLQWDKYSEIIGALWALQKNAWNVVGWSDILLKDGVIPDTVDDTVVDPRTQIYWNDEDYIILMINGRNDGTLGLTRKESAEFALTLGATNGGNNDGGDSCALLVNGEVENNPPDGYLHQVANHVGFWLDGGGTMPETGQFEIVKTVRKRPQPSFYSDYDPNDPDAPQGYWFDSDEIQDVTETIPKVNGIQYTTKWVQLPDLNWVPFTDYKNVTTFVVDHGTPPPPTTEIVFLRGFDADGNEVAVFDRQP